ncbi:hypothetical protein ACFO9Q_14095 [Paenibacillus sp. GCM10023252]|uniref:hypothetical protein n=1 Tax=Paenibacillus sp. GCM10023252 TaxID=3252649 RepID=UPI0036174ED9
MTFQTRNSPRVPGVIVYTIYLGWALYQYLVLFRDNFLSGIFGIVYLILVCILIAFAIYRAFDKPAPLTLADDSLQISPITLTANQVKVIYISGYFKPVIGIKPVGKQLVPIPLSFRFIREQEDEGIKELERWAERNKVKLSRTKFMRWL